MKIGMRIIPGKNIMPRVMHPHVGCTFDSLIVILNVSFISVGLIFTPKKSNDKRKSETTSEVLAMVVLTILISSKQKSIFELL